MRRSGCTVFIFGLACSIGIVHAQNVTRETPGVAPPEEPRIATLNFNAAVLGTIEAQKSLSTIQKKYAPREEQLEKLNTDIETSKKALSDNSANLTDAARGRQLQDIETKEKQLQREAEDLKGDAQAESQQAFQQVAQKVFSFLELFSKQHQYEAVLERGTDAAPVVWYAPSNVDITDQIIKGYDAKSGVTPNALPETPKATQTPQRMPRETPQSR